MARRTKGEYDTLTGRGAPDVHGQLYRSVRRSALSRRDRIYEAAALGVSALKNSGWVDAIAPGTELEIQVREPATCHRLRVQQIRRWCDGVAVSPDETLKKRLKQLLV
jgi:hypothetical protein